MNSKKARILTLLAVGALAAGGSLAATNAGAADHLDAPRVQKDGRTDINDVYVFQSPSDPSLTTLIMTVNPGAGVISGTTFDPNGQYNFEIDDTGDARSDHSLIVRFAAGSGAGQRFSVFVDGDLEGTGMVGETTTLASGGLATAGIFDDPFFFDLDGFNNDAAFTGVDFFAGLNVSAIVLDLPLGNVTSGDKVGVWGRTMKNGRQADLMGRPAINTVLIPSDLKNRFNRTQPDRQPGAFTDIIVSSITGLSGDQTYAEALAAVLLPDLNTFTIGDSAGFPNGRRLADDVIDAELALLTKGALTTDGVDGNDADFSESFPYLAPAN